MADAARLLLLKLSGPGNPGLSSRSVPLAVPGPDQASHFPELDLRSRLLAVLLVRDRLSQTLDRDYLYGNL